MTTTSEKAIQYRARRKVLRQTSGQGPVRVLYGPFEGLLYPRQEAINSPWLPKVLGTYESELHQSLEALCAIGYETVINIGAAEGYYAVGLAKRMPSARVFAFETDPRGQELCREMAELNQVGQRVVVRGTCTTDLLAALLDTRCGLIVCDCEGCELELLRPDKLVNIRNFDLLVELHDFGHVGPTVFQVFASRFSDSHFVETINERQGKPTEHLHLAHLNPIERSLVVSEGRRYSVGWILLWSKKLNSMKGFGRATDLTRANCPRCFWQSERHVLTKPRKAGRLRLRDTFGMMSWRGQGLATSFAPGIGQFARASLQRSNYA